MAVQAAPHRPAIFKEVLLFDVTVTTQIVELLFDQRVDRGISFMTVETQARTGVIDEVVVAVHTVHRAVIGMSEGQWQQRAIGSELLLTRIDADGQQPSSRQ